MKEKTVGLKELRQNIDKYVRAVKNGQEYIVMRRSTPLFKLTPPESEDNWETIIDFTNFKKEGIPLENILKRI